MTPSPADPDAFVYPVEQAVTVTTDSIVVQGSITPRVLDESGAVWTDRGADSWTNEVPPGEYYLEASSLVKTYFWVDAPEGIEIDVDDETGTLRASFGTETEVRIGARSTHERPEATITTSPAPGDVMTAISHFGSALKDDGPMRSFPSLRGHPPLIELGDELRIPDALDRPDTGVTIEVPSAHEWIYPVAPLAYYLGAEIAPGERPTLRTDTGFTYPLDGPGGFERTVEQVLKQTFVCDCFVRTVGPYPSELGRQEAFERDTGLDPAAVYDRPLAGQVETYLDVPFAAVEPYVPQWGVGAHLEPMLESIEYLPFLARDLAFVRSPAIRRPALAASALADAQSVLVEDEFTRGATATGGTSAVGAQPAGPPALDGPTLDDAHPDTRPAPLTWPGAPPQVVVPEPLDAQEQLWIADGIPLGADEPTVSAYRSALARDPVEAIDVVVVCNDERMAAESSVVRDLLDGSTPFGVRVRPFRNLRTTELREVLDRGADFFHYIGHIDDAGFACADGTLDATTLGTVDVDAFFLNACRSRSQGLSLVDAGAIAGVVSLSDLGNDAAVRTGRTMARLLSHGFPLNTGLRLASEEHGLEDRYVVVGDGSRQVVQPEKVAHLVRIETTDEGFEYRLRPFVTRQAAPGSMYAPSVEGIDGWYLSGDEIHAHLSRERLEEALHHADGPVLFDGEFRWASDLVEELRVE